MKKDKAVNDISPELLKYDSESKSLLFKLERILTLIWRAQSTPANGNHCKPVVLLKGVAKDKIKDPSAYREPQIGSALSKITLTIILDRLKNGMTNHYLTNNKVSNHVDGMGCLWYIHH